MNWGIARLLLKADNGGAEFRKGLFQVLTWIIAVVGSLLILYAVYLFFAMATADNEDKRRKARQRVVKIFSSVFIIIALIFALQAIDLVITPVDIEGEKNTGTTTTPVEEEKPAEGTLPITIHGKEDENLKVPINYINVKEISSGSGRYQISSVTAGWSKISDTLCLYHKRSGVLPQEGDLIFENVELTAIEGSSVSSLVDKSFWHIQKTGQALKNHYAFILRYFHEGALVKFPSDFNGLTFKFTITTTREGHLDIKETYEASITVKLLAKDTTASKLLNLPTK